MMYHIGMFLCLAVNLPFAFNGGVPNIISASFITVVWVSFIISQLIRKGII